MNAMVSISLLVITRFIIFLSLPLVCHGLANKLIDDIKFRFLGGTGSVQELDPGTATLQRLRLESDTTPRPFSARPEKIPGLFLASIPAFLRLGSGVFAVGYEVRLTAKDESQYAAATFNDVQLQETCEEGRTSQLKPLLIYEFESCPFCRKVREAVSMLSLNATYCPCPDNGSIYRPRIKAAFGNKATFPVLEDPNTGVTLFESDKILEYLFKTYGTGHIPWLLQGPLVPVSAALGLVWQGGSFRRSSNPPELPLELWGYEGSPFCKLVRERLCEYEIAHTQVSCPRGSPNRQLMLSQKGRFQVPYIEDPNTGVQLFETEAILEYLEKMYGVKDTPIKYL